MDASSFALYAPAINAYLDSVRDSRCKSWDSVVTIFFTMNNDLAFSSKAVLAKTFKYAKYPNYFSIDVNTISKYLDPLQLTKASLSEIFTEGDDFMEDDEGIRLSFESFRRMMFRSGRDELIDAYAFVDKIYCMYGRYQLAMMSRSRCPTHWTLVERIGGFSQSMQPHIDFTKNPEKSKFITMDKQPKVYSIFKGTLKSLKARIQKYKASHDKEMVKVEEVEQKLSRSTRSTRSAKTVKSENPSKSTTSGNKQTNETKLCKYAPQQIGEIYESVTINIEDEINAVIGFIDENVAKPFRAAQIGVDKSMSITETKQLIKLTKTCIMIDSNQNQYTADHLIEDIISVRSRIKLGQKIHSKKESVPKFAKVIQTNANGKQENFTDINIFYNTRGNFVDTFNLIKVFSRDCGVSLPTELKVRRTLSFSDADRISEDAILTDDDVDDIEEDMEEDMEDDLEEDDLEEYEAEVKKEVKTVLPKEKRIRNSLQTPRNTSTYKPEITVVKPRGKRIRGGINAHTDDEQ